jgi:translation initiation factor IF-1
MAKEDTFKLEGVVVEALPDASFRVKLKMGDNNETVVIAHLCGKMRMKNIRVLAGDKVTIEMTPYDLTQARIIYRHK